MRDQVIGAFRLEHCAINIAEAGVGIDDYGWEGQNNQRKQRRPKAGAELRQRQKQDRQAGHQPQCAESIEH